MTWFWIVSPAWPMKSTPRGAIRASTFWKGVPTWFWLSEIHAAVKGAVGPRAVRKVNSGLWAAPLRTR